jgi:L-cysteine desulfidase
METRQFLDLLKRELMIAMGCTEPAAAALAGAKAGMLLGEPVEKLDISASRDMVKNAMGVGLPNCTMRGIQAAVALGAAGGDIARGLGILSEISESQKLAAARYSQEGKVALQLLEDVPPVYIGVVASGLQHSAEAVISGEHSRFVRLRKDEGMLLDLPLAVAEESRVDDSFTNEMIANLSLQDIVDAANRIAVEELDFVLQGAKTNMAIARHAMEHEYGLAVGRTMGSSLPEAPTSLDDAYALGAALAASASDARMAGCPLPVVINSGSGNQGITVSVPLLVMASHLGIADAMLVRALFVSHLVALVLTAKKDRLSALCGAFTAAIGTACGLVYLQGGSVDALDMAVNNMVGNLTGIICDGAKGTCALKIYSSVQAAAVSSRLALKGMSPRDESGIVGRDALQSFSYLTQISHEGMEQTDRTILAIMMGKQEVCER